MVATRSSMLALGGSAAHFELADVSNNNELVSLADFKDRPLLIMFICNHCPFVVHLLPTLATLANSAKVNGMGVVAISSNDAQAYPQDGPQAMNEFAQHHAFDFPYLYDQSQSVAKAYQAACTPDFYLFDKSHILVYRGQMDGARPGNGVAVSGEALQSAIEAVLCNQHVSQEQLPSVGCSIKWLSNQAPNYL